MTYLVKRKSWVRKRLRWVLSWIPAKTRERLAMRWRLGYWPNLSAPRTFNEKIAYRKLFDQSPEYVELADKYAVRNFVASRVGNEHLAELVGIFEKAADIPFESLPNRFVLKGTHDSGSVVVVNEKQDIDLQSVVSWFDTEEFRNPLRLHNEWWYESIPPRIVVEESLVSESGAPPWDYKVFCFDGSPLLIQVDADRFGSHKRSFFDTSWRLIDMALSFPSAGDLPRPNNLDGLIEIACRLSEGFDFVRVDLYELTGGRIVFGELTFAPDGGWGRFSPDVWDHRLGDYWSFVAEE